MGKVGRPPKKIDVEQLIKLANNHWSDNMIAAFFDIHPTNLRIRFGKEIDAGRQHAKAKLVNAMWMRIGERSDRILEHALNRFLGSIPQKLELTDEIVDTYIDQKSAADPSAIELEKKS